jgi:MoaA/NifB/PqqE/SkfB family radical SAM enzyme
MTVTTPDPQSVGLHAGDHRREVLQRRFNDRPLLVFWEMTKACDLACFHCRADAQHDPSPCELTTDEGRHLIDELAQLASPRPILILTGGDCLKRPDLLELIDYARSASVPVALAPSVTPLLTRERMRQLREHGIKTVSISLDGMNADTHDAVRGVSGHFDATMVTLRELKDAGFTVQINTTVMACNVEQMADIAQLLHAHRIDIWEVFFLISTGRGTDVNASTPQQNEDICNFLVDASQYGFTVRSVEGPFLRRVNQQRHEGLDGPATGELCGLAENLTQCAPRAPPPVTATASSSSAPPATSTLRVSCPCPSAICATRRWSTSIAIHHSCCRFATPPLTVRAAHARFASYAAARGRAPSPRRVTRSAQTPRACSSTSLVGASTRLPTSSERR